MEFINFENSKNQNEISNKNKQEVHLSAFGGIKKMKESIESIKGISLVDFFNTEKGREFLTYKKILLVGPPRSGKSCMREALKQAIKEIPLAPYPYVLTACPDGEGSWFQESVNNDSELATRLKAEYKGKFNPEFVKRISDSVKNLKLPLNFIDIGGIISPENREICKEANSAIMLCGEESILSNRPAEWKQFLNELEIPIIAEIYSDYFGTEDCVIEKDEDGIFRASIHHLERGEACASRKTVRELAKYIIELGSDKN